MYWADIMDFKCMAHSASKFKSHYICALFIMNIRRINERNVFGVSQVKVAPIIVKNNFKRYEARHSHYFTHKKDSLTSYHQDY